MNEPVRTSTETAESAVAEQDSRRSFSRWLKRVGLVGFLFFLIKGLLWILIPALVIKGCS